MRVVEAIIDGARRRSGYKWNVEIEYKNLTDPDDDDDNDDNEDDGGFEIPAPTSDEPQWTFRTHEVNSKLQVQFDGGVSYELPMLGEEDLVDSFRFTSGDTISLYYRVISSDKMLISNPGKDGT